MAQSSACRRHGNLTHALDAREPLHLEKAIELRVVGVEEIAQDVDVAPGVDGRHLDAVDNADAVRLGRLAAPRPRRPPCRGR